MANKPTTKKEQIKFTSAGAHFTAIIDKVKYTIKPTAEERTLVKKEIEAFNLKNSNDRKKKLITLLKPKEEKKKQEVMVSKKVAKKKAKEAKVEALPEKQKALNEVIDTVQEIVEQKEAPKQEEIQKVTELARHQLYRGYKSPVTGLTWNGERYV